MCRLPTGAVACSSALNPVSALPIRDLSSYVHIKAADDSFPPFLNAVLKTLDLWRVCAARTKMVFRLEALTLETRKCVEIGKCG
jgi:hypothetical protein